MQEYYAAPMEGLTGWRWRQVQSELFGGADRYYTPFLSPNANFEFQTKELQEIDVSVMTPLDALNTLYRLQNKLKNRW